MTGVELTDHLAKPPLLELINKRHLATPLPEPPLPSPLSHPPEHCKHYIRRLCHPFMPSILPCVAFSLPGTLVIDKERRSLHPPESITSYGQEGRSPVITKL